MALCGSQNCGCAFASSATIAVTGSGTPGARTRSLAPSSHAATIDVFTASGTWTKPAGLAYIEVEVQAGGGGSGGCAATAASKSRSAAVEVAAGTPARSSPPAPSLPLKQSRSAPAERRRRQAPTLGVLAAPPRSERIARRAVAWRRRWGRPAVDHTVVGPSTAVGGTATGGDVNIAGGSSVMPYCNRSRRSA